MLTRYFSGSSSRHVGLDAKFEAARVGDEIHMSIQAWLTKAAGKRFTSAVEGELAFRVNGTTIFVEIEANDLMMAKTQPLPNNLHQKSTFTKGLHAQILRVNAADFDGRAEVFIPVQVLSCLDDGDIGEREPIESLKATLLLSPEEIASIS